MNAPLRLSDLVKSGPDTQPPCILVYAEGGRGKTTLIAGMPAPIFLQTESGLGQLDVPRFPLIESWQQLSDATRLLYDEPHEFRSLGFDSLDWLEPIIHAEACRREGLKSIDEANTFGRGYVAADNVWREFYAQLNYLRRDRGMAIGLIAHSEVKKHESPDQPPYDRYQIKLHKRGAALALEHVDATFFLNFVVSTTEDKAKGVKAGEGHKRGVGGGQRRVFTEGRPAFLAKNRWRMPDFIDLPDDPDKAWPTVAQHIPYFAQQGV